MPIGVKVVGDITGKDLSIIKRICLGCGQEKVETEFDINYHRKYNKAYLAPRCKPCARIAANANISKDPAKRTEKNFNWLLYREYGTFDFGSEILKQ